MLKHLFVVFLLVLATNSFAQNPIKKERDSLQVKRDSINKAEAKSMKDLGAVMKLVMPALKGKADGKLINKIVREELEKIEN